MIFIDQYSLVFLAISIDSRINGFCRLRGNEGSKGVKALRTLSSGVSRPSRSLERPPLLAAHRIFFDIDALIKKQCPYETSHGPSSESSKAKLQRYWCLVFPRGAATLGSSAGGTMDLRKERWRSPPAGGRTQGPGPTEDRSAQEARPCSWRKRLAQEVGGGSRRGKAAQGAAVPGSRRR